MLPGLKYALNVPSNVNGALPLRSRCMGIREMDASTCPFHNLFYIYTTPSNDEEMVLRCYL